MVGMHEEDEGVEFQYSSIHSIYNKKILAKPQLHTSKLYFLLCHWVFSGFQGPDMPYNHFPNKT